jgi:hypothetical protein
MKPVNPLQLKEELQLTLSSVWLSCELTLLRTMDIMVRMRSSVGFE